MDSTQDKINLPFLKQVSAFRWVFVLLTGFAVANMGAHALALRDTALPNPFAAYADIFPGQPASAIEARAFSCPRYNNDFRTYCTFTPVDDEFSNVTVIMFAGKIHQISFIVRENRLTVGDLALIFETRAVHKFPHTAYFALPRQGSFAIVNAIGYEGRFSVFLPVRKITFTENTLPSR